MRIAFASGKGGAGKTMLTAALHRAWPWPHILVDTDVEAPNLHLFTKPDFKDSFQVNLKVPQSINSNCTSCGSCRKICRYGAIAQFGKNLKLFPDMCHGCGGCFAVCGPRALEEGKRELGQVKEGRLKDGTLYLSGETRVGEVMTPPLLRQLLERLEEHSPKSKLDSYVLVDAPPGVSCPAVTVAKQVDLMVLVVDPSPFGVADFKLAYAAFKSLDLPLLAVLNRTGIAGTLEGEREVQAFCAEHGVEVVGNLPFAKDAAKYLAKGVILADLSIEWMERFRTLAHNLIEKAWQKINGS